MSEPTTLDPAVRAVQILLAGQVAEDLGAGTGRNLIALHEAAHFLLWVINGENPSKLQIVVAPTYGWCGPVGATNQPGNPSDQAKIEGLVETQRICGAEPLNLDEIRHEVEAILKRNWLFVCLLSQNLEQRLEAHIGGSELNYMWERYKNIEQGD